MNFNNCIISQVHIPDFDVQGSLYKEDKIKIVELSIKHLRKYNKDAYVILSGHGHRPNNETVKNCDYVYWEDKLRQLTSSGLVEGMPAQFYFVSMGIKHAIECGFKYCLKTRTDCIIGIPDIVPFCHNIIEKEKKLLLITQQTSSIDPRMGDCFMYGDIFLMDRIWDYANKVVSMDGLVNTGIHFIECFDETLSWVLLVKKYCSFRDMISLKFTDLRWNYNDLKNNLIEHKNNILNNNFDFLLYCWGRKNNWHVFDKQGNMIVNFMNEYWTESSFYNK
jgi:hypothetical protein